MQPKTAKSALALSRWRGHTKRPILASFGYPAEIPQLNERIAKRSAILTALGAKSQRPEAKSQYSFAFFIIPFTFAVLIL